MRRPINSVNGFYKDPNLPFSAQDALNVLPMMAEKGGTRTLSKLVDAPGLKPFVRIGVNDGVDFTPAGAGRGMRVVDNKLFVVAGRNLWQITAAGVSINHGTIPGVARVSMAHNQRGLGNELAIDNGQARYVFNTQSLVLQKVTDETFPGSIKAFFIDGYLGYIEPQGRYWGHSDQSNALNYIAFDEYEAEGQPDRIVSGHVSNREVLIAGERTIEAYVNSPSGSGEAPFVRATNTVIESGCSARDSFCTVGQYTVYLDQNRTVQVLNGYTPVAISTSVVDSALQACTRQQIANAYAFAVEAEGFLIYYLTVPGKFTFGYDFKNREWHRRASNGLDWWAVTDVVQWNGDWVALDSRTGELFKLRWRDYPFDGQQELVREWVTGVVSADQNPIFVHELELLFASGGEEYETVDFPEQPVGPTITGNAPNGAVAIEWGPYNYTVTGGTAPYVVSLRPGGTLPPGVGPLSAAGVIAAGTPTTFGRYTFTVRVTDANGLWDEVEDEIQIIQTVLATGDFIASSEPVASLYNAGEWVTIPFAAMNLTNGQGAISDGRYVVVTNASSRYSDDLVTWDTGTSTGANELTCCTAGNGVFVATGGSDTIIRSANSGESFSAVTPPVVGSYAWGSVAYGDGIWVIGSLSNQAHLYSTDDCVTLEQYGSNVFSYQMTCVKYLNGRFVAGGGTSTVTDPGQIRTSVDNSSWNAVVNDAPSLVVDIAYGNGIDMAVCSEGEIIYSDDGWATHTLSPFSLPGSSTNRYLVFDGVSFLVSYDNGFDNAVTYASEDGITWGDPQDTGLATITSLVV